MVGGRAWRHVRATVPLVVVPGDSPNKVMARTPELMGLSLRRVAWRFGFQPGRVLAQSTGIACPHALWVMAVYSGTVIELVELPWQLEPPHRFLNCLVAPLEHDRRDLGGLHPGAAGVSPATSAKD